ncbi:uncharacterized protein F5891DRAFT_1212612 [Suillus fuscotomentosus]|uniref:Uncharacterized protein n=1 Tax=Suillus fuscotomentosus TaxID=1912939 RepID=A0AAD4HDP0_9AGAM|nr:uncharacterized protein F5891DRAFT_1212612 [Suillus fuscotomentosus]KAG1890671.1 hypothetical protein F5891DRAFT_1212612 [Suillus fuscotomentosus]
MTPKSACRRQGRRHQWDNLMACIEAAIIAEATAEVVEVRAGGTDVKLGHWKRVKGWLSRRKRDRWVVIDNGEASADLQRNGKGVVLLDTEDGSTGTGLCFGIPGDDEAETMRAVQSSMPGSVGVMLLTLEMSMLNNLVMTYPAGRFVWLSE